jgi:hypothetical protein
MNSTPDPNATEPRDAQVAGADERLAHAHEQIIRADEELARLSERLAKIEGDTARPASAGPASAETEPGPQSPPARSARRALIGLPLAACIVVAVLALSSYGGGAKLVVARWAPQLAPTPSSSPENPPPSAQPAPSIVQVAAAEPAPPQATPPQATPSEATPPPATSLAQAQTTPQDAAPAATAAPPDQTQLLQTMARDLANLERNIEQLKANQQQMAGDNSKAIGELRASQEEMKRALAKVSEPNPPKASAPPPPPAPTARKPERTRQSPYARAPPRYYPREWIYDDW